jgi:hypothetical protein
LIRSIVFIGRQRVSSPAPGASDSSLVVMIMMILVGLAKFYILFLCLTRIAPSEETFHYAPRDVDVCWDIKTPDFRSVALILGLSLIVRTWTLRFVETEETHKWRKITAAAYVASIGMIFYTFAGDEHEHDEHAGHAERPVMTTFCVCIARERENQSMGRNPICHLPWLICGQNRTRLLWSLR